MYFKTHQINHFITVLHKADFDISFDEASESKTVRKKHSHNDRG